MKFISKISLVKHVQKNSGAPECLEEEEDAESEV